ncbi:hypothetical protein V6U90_11350 [Micromonospora sp. CPCC 206060]|uniref:hypothetical protein n=1 Tax=Micromonospora sp. CPCC 206060 TaxID=3122406 RepID=UPI002FEE7560
MTSPHVPAPTRAMEQFLAGIAPFDSRPDQPVMTVTMRVGPADRTFTLTHRAASALVEVLNRYADPDDCGRCGGCGGFLDRNFQCRSCGQLDGVFGSTVARHLAGADHRDDR